MYTAATDIGLGFTEKYTEVVTLGASSAFCYHFHEGRSIRTSLIAK